MLIGRKTDILSSEITPQGVYARRRELLIKAAGALGVLAAAPALSLFCEPRTARAGTKLANVHKSAYTANEDLTSLKDISTYNNYYEFGTEKTEPSENAHTLKTRPWTVAVEGEVKKPKVFDIEEL